MINNKKAMVDCVYNQLAIDYNCSPDDFLKDGLIFTEAKDNKERRLYPWRTPRLEMVTMGNGVVINASADVLAFVREQLDGYDTRRGILYAICLRYQSILSA